MGCPVIEVPGAVLLSHRRILIPVSPLQPLKGPAGQVRVNRAALGSNLMTIGAAKLAFSGLLADPAGYFVTHAFWVGESHPG